MNGAGYYVCAETVGGWADREEQRIYDYFIKLVIKPSEVSVYECGLDDILYVLKEVLGRFAIYKPVICSVGMLSIHRQNDQNGK